LCVLYSVGDHRGSLDYLSIIPHQQGRWGKEWTVVKPSLVHL
jgi:hypothetical protein